MKKLNKKVLGVGLIVLFFSLFLIFLAKAQEGEHLFFRVNSASTTRAGAERAGDKALIKIINRSDKDYFVPNKTRQEFDSFNANPPRYVSTAICGDKVCSEGENTYTPMQLSRHRRYAAQGFRVVAISTKTSGLRPSKKTQIGFDVARRAA